MMSDPKIEHVTVSLGDRGYRISIASGLLAGTDAPGVELLRLHVSGRKVLLTADSNTAPLYGDRVRSILLAAGATDVTSYLFPAGEESKTVETVADICRTAARAGLDRKSLIAALGGGVTGDMAGFAAAIYMRGIDFLQLPTSLLAMIDSSVGGKTGVDLPEGKNLIGCFLQPRSVMMDVSFLETLPPSERRCGCAELIKHAILFDPDLFRDLESDPGILLNMRLPDRAASLIARSCRLKAHIVAADEHENGCRALLNLGHSFGHAVERLRMFRMSHGDAVGLGCAMAATLAVQLGRLDPADADRIRGLLTAYGLPVRIAGLTPAAIRAAMTGDKKNFGGRPRLILPDRIGSCAVCPDVPEDQLLKAIGAHCDGP